MMRIILLPFFCFLCLLAEAQRPSTKAEHDEDTRVLNLLSQAMPHNLPGWVNEGASSNGSSDLSGLTDFHNDMNFAARDIFQDEYTISWRLENPDPELKKYFPEKPVKPVPGLNTFSFSMVGSDGQSKEIRMQSASHDFSNGACLVNHNEDPRVLQEAQINFHITDDKNHDLLFMMAIPVIRSNCQF